MQSLCQARIGWDDTIPEPLIAQWRKLVLTLSESQPMTIPRCYLDGVNSEILSIIGYVATVMPHSQPMLLLSIY